VGKLGRNLEYGQIWLYTRHSNLARPADIKKIWPDFGRAGYDIRCKPSLYSALLLFNFIPAVPFQIPEHYSHYKLGYYH